jgi:AraC-like DNA-binding protein
VGASLWIDQGWLSIHEEQNLLVFEMQHGVLEERWVYNERCIQQALTTQRPVLGEHNGFCDLFVPVVPQPVRAVLVSGPFSRSRLTAPEILERWSKLTKRRGKPSDREFSRYLMFALSTLVLEPEDLARFQRALEFLVSLMTSQGSVPSMVAEIAKLTSQLGDVRFAERAWSIAREMVDEDTSRIWSRRYRLAGWMDIGLSRFPDTVMVGLFSSRHRDASPLEELLRGEAFQRACVELARKEENVVCGRIGQHGVTFLSSAPGSARRKLLALADKASRLADRHGVDLHTGISTLSLPLPAQYPCAVAAAESALSQGVRVLHAKPISSSTSRLGVLRRELARIVEEKPSSLAARFDAYIAAVATSCGYQLEPSRAHLDAAFERMSDGLAASGTLEGQSWESMSSSLQHDASVATTISELFGTYRRAVEDLVAVVTGATPARHDRNLHRAEAYLRKHYTTRVTLKQVARVAGFAPNYFSQLFRETQDMTFSAFLMKLRVERAQELLVTTSLSLDRVAQLCGLVRRQHLIRVLKRTTGGTPTDFRSRLLTGREWGQSRDSVAPSTTNRNAGY